MPQPPENQYQRWVCITSVFGAIERRWQARRVEKAQQFNPPQNFDQTIRSEMERLHQTIQTQLQTGGFQNVNDLHTELRRAFQAPESLSLNLDVNSPLVEVMEALIAVLNSLLEGRLLNDENFADLLHRLNTTAPLQALAEHVKEIIKGCIDMIISIKENKVWEQLKDVFGKPELHQLLASFIKSNIEAAIIKCEVLEECEEFSKNMQKCKITNFLNLALNCAFVEVSLPTSYSSAGSVSLSIRIVNLKLERVRDPSLINQKKSDL